MLRSRKRGSNKKESGERCLKVTNPTNYDAVVTVLADQSKSGSKVGAVYSDDMKKIRVSSGEEVCVVLA